MRSLDSTIDEMITVIPLTETILLRNLTNIKSSYIISAPEMNSFWWSHCSDILINCIGDLDTKWADKVADIFNGINSIDPIELTRHYNENEYDRNRLAHGLLKNLVNNDVDIERLIDWELKDVYGVWLMLSKI